MGENAEKRKALEVAMSQIEKQFGKGSVMKLGEYKAMEVEAIPTGALSLDIALGIGGVPRGRIIEVFGPESSGKTTFAQKLGVQLKLMGFNPITISMDNYFVERVDNPLDEEGNYDFECVEALDRDLFNSQMRDLIEGKTVELPRFDFIHGNKEYKGDFLKLEKNDILIVEGIHALNPILTEFTPDKNKYKIY